MRHKELGLKTNVKWNGLWTASHKITAPSWKEIGIISLLKLLGKAHELQYTEDQMRNALLDEGELDILNVYLRNTSIPASFYFGLGNLGGTPGVPAETDTLATITEVSGSGYARIALARDTIDWGAPVLLDSPDYQTTSVTKQFAATGTWTAADYLFLTDVSTGTAGALIAAVALSLSRVLNNGDKLDVSMTVKLQ